MRALGFSRSFGGRALNGLVEDIAFGVNIERRLGQRETCGEVADDYVRRAQRVIFVERLADAVGDAAARQNENRLITGGRLALEFGGEVAEATVPAAHRARRDFDLRSLRLGRKKK